MPTEINLDTFLKLAADAESCRVKRLGDVVKLKIRTSRRLCTFETEKGEAEDIIKKLKCKIVEV
ncbi:MAG: hypothetical protein V1850_06445 [Candidatus Bathyarchaeota archaeon]